MGDIEIADIDLSTLRPSNDESKRIGWNRPGVFHDTRYGLQLGVEVHWGVDLKMTGSYRVETRFSRSDVLHLFRTTFGDELNVSLIEEYGFTVSPDLAKAILKTVKLTDLTLGELMEIQKQPAKNSAPEESSEAVEAKPALSGVRRRV